jgi:arylsulfatase A-like enzyme
LPLLKGASAEQKTHDFLYWEFCDGANKIISQAVRQGSWKAFRPIGKPMEVYNLDQDPFETNDLAKDMPDKVMAMQVLMTQAHTPPPKR